MQAWQSHVGAWICQKQGRHETVTSNSICGDIQKFCLWPINLRDSRIKTDQLANKFVLI